MKTTRQTGGKRKSLIKPPQTKSNNQGRDSKPNNNLPRGWWPEGASANSDLELGLVVLAESIRSYQRLDFDSADGSFTGLLELIKHHTELHPLVNVLRVLIRSMNDLNRAYGVGNSLSDGKPVQENYSSQEREALVYFFRFFDELKGTQFSKAVEIVSGFNKWVTLDRGPLAEISEAMHGLSTAAAFLDELCARSEAV